MKKFFNHTIIKLPILILISLLILVSFNSCKKKEEPETIKIGAILPLTGPASSFGQYVKEGIELALDEINSTATSIKLTILYEDSKGNPSDAVSIYNKLTNIEKTPIIIAALSSVASAIQPLASKTKTINIFVDVVKPGVADGEWSFRFYPEAKKTAGKLAQFSLSLGYKRAFILHINDAYGETSYSTFKEILERNNGKVIGDEVYEFTQTDFRPIVTKIKNIEDKIDVIYLNGYGQSFAKALKQIREMGITKPIVADVALGLPENRYIAGEAAEGVYYIDNPISNEFVEKFNKKFNKEPSSDAAYAYDVILIINSILQKNPKGGFEFVRNALKKLYGYSGVSGRITMTSTGDADIEFAIFQIKNGRPQLVK